MMDINVGGTQNIIDKCLEHKECKKLVYVGSTGSIPEAPKGSVMKEISYYDPEPVISAYGKSKAMASQLVLDAVKNQHLNACLVLPSGILGPGDNAIGQVTDGLLKQMNGEAAIGINGTFNLCDVRDLANAVILAEKMENPERAIFWQMKSLLIRNLQTSLQKKVTANAHSSSFRFHWLLSLQIYWKNRRRRRAPHLHLQNT